jgi:hypothetical protein
MKCIPTRQGGWYVCRRCGWGKGKMKTTFHRKCPKAPSRGLGDTVAKLTKKLGIKSCGGCKKRQRLLNRLVSYKTREAAPLTR